MENIIESPISLEETLNYNQNDTHIPSFFGTKSGGATLFGLVGGLSIGIAVALDYLDVNPLNTYAASVGTLIISGLFADRVYGSTLNIKNRPEYNYDREFFKQVFFIPQISAATRGILGYFSNRRTPDVNILPETDNLGSFVNTSEPITPTLLRDQVFGSEPFVLDSSETTPIPIKPYKEPIRPLEEYD